MSTEMICYEQPANEHARAYLRLEYLFKHIHHSMQGASSWDSRATLTTIIDILNILDRPDLKAKITKEVNRYLLLLSRLENTQHIDQEKLGGILAELGKLAETLHTTNGKLGQELRENEFLNNIRLHLTTPAGTCDFDTPAYALWLQRPAEERAADLNHWLSSFSTVYRVVTLILHLIRQSATSEPKTATEGFFQMSLDPQAPCQLIRLELSREFQVFPEVSVGRHGISVRYCDLKLNGERPSQTARNIPFDLSVCIF